MLDHAFTIADASALDYGNATKLQLSPPLGAPRAVPGNTVAIASLSTDPTDFVAITSTAAAGLAVQLIRALGIEPPNDLLAFSRNVGDAVHVASPVADPRDDLLRQAFDALAGFGTEDHMRVALSIGQYLIGRKDR